MFGVMCALLVFASLTVSLHRSLRRKRRKISVTRRLGCCENFKPKLGGTTKPRMSLFNVCVIVWVGWLCVHELI